MWKAGGAEQNAIQAKQKELNDLRDQMQEKTAVYRLEAKKIAPDFDMGMGVGREWVMGPGWVWARPGGAWAPEMCRRRPPNSHAAINPLKLKSRNRPSAIPGLHAESAAKGDEHGTDCARYYHYFAGWSLPQVAT